MSAIPFVAATTSIGQPGVSLEKPLDLPQVPNRLVELCFGGNEESFRSNVLLSFWYGICHVHLQYGVPLESVRMCYELTEYSVHVCAHDLDEEFGRLTRYLLALLLSSLMLCMQ